MKTIYSNQTQTFQIIDYVATHGQLLLRSFKTKDRKYNIDILFKVVEHLLIPTTIHGIDISVLENEEKISFLKEEYGFTTKHDYRIFLIKDSTGKSHYINALCFGVYHNTLETLETSMGFLGSGVAGERQLWYPPKPS